MDFKRVGTTYIVRLYKGEEIGASLKEFARKYGITAGFINGIGAVDDVILGYFHMGKKIYIEEHLEEDFELLSLMGNFALIDDEPFAHLHIMLGRDNYQVIGGHMVQARVSVTCEIYIQAADTIIKRVLDEGSGLKLMDLS
ncbi:MAG: PPC domain-containing DNA-binding protein [Vulcanimicrobiota bacterium]